jgi:hyperosmotically inducible periplasmic protein
MKAIAIAILGGMLTIPAAVARNNDAQIQAGVQKALSGSEFKGIQAYVHDGVVTLAGSTGLVAHKLRAERKAEHVDGVVAVRDEIQVTGPDVPDQRLQNELLKKIEYDMVGYGTTPFDAISVHVHDGVAVLSGHAYGPVDASDALAIAENTKGVKDVINNIQIDPVSPSDDRIRLAVFRKVYGFPTLNKYALNPLKPIRIQVANGNVTLYGVVDSEADKEAAGIQASSVPGVFSVTNDLQVAGQPVEKPGE